MLPDLLEEPDLLDEPDLLLEADLPDLLDFPDFSAEELIRGGTKLMKGHLRRLYFLYLSFLPMYLLTLLSFGIAGLWVSSYTHAAEAAFYKDLMANTKW